jgi:hypothetical protein
MKIFTLRRIGWKEAKFTESSPTVLPFEMVLSSEKGPGSGNE